MIGLSAVSNHWPFIIGAWAVTAAAVGGYAGSVLRRGRRLSRQLPPEERRWM
ncbi:MAG: heme exporter protein CcmD [Microthrixaceae bacterium]|nr:heme exporter protein CcmD [Microthrixaceae bacterium]